MSRFFCSIDTNVLLRLIVGDVPAQYEEAKKLLTEANGPIFVSDTVFVEVIFVLSREYKLTRYQIKQAIIGLLSIEVITCNSAALTKALNIYVGAPSLSFEDCIIGVQASLNDALPLYTFDKKFATQHPNAVLLK